MENGETLLILGLRNRLVAALLLVMFVLTPLPAYAGQWQYGASMAPTTTNYDAYEMPTSGMYNWNSMSSGNVFFFFSSASNSGTGGGFAQNGFMANRALSILSVSDTLHRGMSKHALIRTRGVFGLSIASSAPGRVPFTTGTHCGKLLHLLSILRITGISAAQHTQAKANTRGISPTQQRAPFMRIQNVPRN